MPVEMKYLFRTGDRVRLKEDYARSPGVVVPAGTTGTVEGDLLDRGYGSEESVVLWLPDGADRRVSCYARRLEKVTRTPVFIQNDIVRLAVDFSPAIKKGQLAVVISADNHTAYIRPVGFTSSYEVPLGALEMAKGSWVRLPEYPGPLLQGKTLVRPVRNLTSSANAKSGSPQTTYLKHSVHVYTPYDTTRGRTSAISLLRHDPAHSWSTSMFEVFVEEGQVAPLEAQEATVTSDTSKALPFATAVEKAQVLNRETGNQGLYRARQRSWDKIGLYAAVDVYAPGNTLVPQRKLYTLQDVGEEMTRLVAQRTPVDVIGQKSSMYPYLSFTLPNGGILYAPDGSKWWNERQVRNCGGIVTVDGKRYRLCTRVITSIKGRAFRNDEYTDEVVPIVP